MICALVGCGNWGARIARRLAELDDVILSAVFDDDAPRARDLAASLSSPVDGERTTALKDFTQYLDVMTPDAIVLAVPAGHRLPYVEAVCNQQRTRKQRIRIEKPLGMDVEEAERIVDMCAAAGVDLTIGFTLLHHPLYAAVFRLIDRHGDRGVALTALRSGRGPAHPIDPMLDLGIHAASIAAHLGIDRLHTGILAMHDENVGARETNICLAGGGTIHVDEIALTARTPYGVLHAGDNHDALGCDLRAWIDGTHRGTPQVALAAQHIATPLRIEVCA